MYGGVLFGARICPLSGIQFLEVGNVLQLQGRRQLLKLGGGGLANL